MWSDVNFKLSIDSQQAIILYERKPYIMRRVNTDGHIFISVTKRTNEKSTDKPLNDNIILTYYYIIHMYFSSKRVHLEVFIIIIISIPYPFQSGLIYSVVRIKKFHHIFFFV